MQEFICPNGRMSVNGVCPMFENDVSQQIETFENNPFKQPFKFDFEKETPSSKKNAFDIIGENINAYDSFVQDKLGISPGVQNVARIGATVLTGSLMPFAIPFVAGGALRASDNRRVQNITMQDPQGTINTINLQKAATGPSYSTGGIGTSAGASRDPAGTGGGSQQATSAGATNTGRTDGGWGW